MTKCPYCHIEYNSNESFTAHIGNCAFKNDPLPESKQESKATDYSGMKMDELKKLAGEKGIDASGLKKEELINKLTEVNK